MATILDKAKDHYIPSDNNFYRDHYHHILVFVMIIIVGMMAMLGMVLYQMMNRPLPIFQAIQPSGQKMQLTAYTEPNLLPDTILNWAEKAATAAYTFDFVNYNKQIEVAHPYFTDAGWQDYLASVRGVINTVVKNQLFINGVVSGVPVISNQGPLPSKGYSWRIQIPFLVTYQSANLLSQRRFVVVLTIIRIPTSINPQGIGIDQFVMVTV